MMKTKIKYFCLSEFLHSDTAIKNDIENMPSWENIKNLEELVLTILDPLREAYGKPITITSGFRCKKLNKLVGGSDTSAHIIGWAADLVPDDGKIESFIDFAITWLISNNIPFDQAIDEKDKKGNHWLHIGLKNLEGRQRGETKKMIKA